MNSVRKPLHWNVSGQLCILAVDDDQVNLMVLEQLLSSEGYKILFAPDGTEALQALEENSTWPDVVFLDYYLGTGETGEEVCQKMRQVFNGVDVPIILCTALGDGAAAIQQALQAGASDYLLKPYERNKMLDKIKKHVPNKLAGPPPTLTPSLAPATATTSAASPNLAPSTPTASDSTSTTFTCHPVMEFCISLDLKYCGMKLVDAGINISQLKAMDDVQLRKHGIVVKSQRDKILQALAKA